jgi:RHS repeat-associated protein
VVHEAPGRPVERTDPSVEAEIAMLPCEERTGRRVGSHRDRGQAAPRVGNGRLVERYVYRPYGEATVHQLGGYADYDGDGDVDANDRGEITGLTCGGASPSGACRVLDLDFDLILDSRLTRHLEEPAPPAYDESVMYPSHRGTAGRVGSLRDQLPRVKDDNDCDSSDETLFDALPHTGTVVHPARRSSLLGQPFAHQGLFLDPEIGSYQNRARQYDPGLRRFVQRDPLAFRSTAGSGLDEGLNLFTSADAAPLSRSDPMGLRPIPPWENPWEYIDRGIPEHAPDRPRCFLPSVYLQCIEDRGCDQAYAFCKQLIVRDYNACKRFAAGFYNLCVGSCKGRCRCSTECAARCLACDALWVPLDKACDVFLVSGLAGCDLAHTACLGGCYAGAWAYCDELR